MGKVEDLKNQIKEFLKEKQQATLKEIYSAIPDKTTDNIRGVINLHVNVDFERIGRGTYKLK